MARPDPLIEPIGGAAADLDLIRAVLRRDRKATADFVAAHADAVYSYLCRRLFPNVVVVEDILQEVFLAALEALPQFKGESGVRAWLLGIARHKVQDHYRARVEDGLGDAAEHDVAADEQPLDDRLHEEQLSARVRSTLEELPENYRCILLWRYWEKCSAAEMARRCGRTEKAVERMLARARDRFRRRWQGD